jgi:MFS family permease
MEESLGAHPSYAAAVTVAEKDGVDVDAGRAQRRTLVVLSLALVLGGLGVSGAVTGGGLLVSEVSGRDGLAGLGQTSVVLGSAVMAVPLARLSARFGRRIGLASGYGAGVLGAGLVVLGSAATSTLVLLIGLTLFGTAVAAGLQSRFAATDLSAPSRVGRDLSVVVWMTSVGAVVGPNIAQPAAATGTALGLPGVSGIFVWSGAGFVLAALLVLLALRPDPLVLARRRRTDAGGVVDPPRPTLRATFAGIGASPPARFAFAAVVAAHAAMVGLMVMTPLHLDHGGHGLRVVGVVISVHVAGMYLFAPLVGAAADAVGEVVVIAVGAVTMATGGVLAATAPSSASTTVGIALFLLGIGWSCCSVAGAALLTRSVPPELRPSAQGATDFAMGLAAATAGALAGVVFGIWSYAVLGAAVAVLIAPIAVLAVARGRPGLVSSSRRGPTTER